MLPIDATTERGQQMRDCCGMFDPGWHGRFGVEVDQLPHVGHPPYLRQCCDNVTLQYLASPSDTI